MVPLLVGHRDAEAVAEAAEVGEELEGFGNGPS